MCYAIPGKVTEITGSIITIEYFDISKKVRNDFIELALGDYVYAQGGFVIQKVLPDEAKEILQTWKEFFFQLKETDLRLTRQTKDIYQIANSVRQKHIGNASCVHGIIEFSNYCRSNCLYCGLRKDNCKLKRYRMEIDEIVDLCDYAVNKLGFKALVLQSGEDLWYDDEKLLALTKKIFEKCKILLIFSIGERELQTFVKLYEAGVRGVLLRFETSNEEIYKKIKPECKLSDRLNLIKKLTELGYLIMTGFLIGLPDETEKDVLNNIKLSNDLKTELFSFGPFIPHPDTPLSNFQSPSLELVLETTARARILYPESKILVTTALETLDKENAARSGLLAGANSLMVNLTPKKYRDLYEIYPNRAGTDLEIDERIKKVISILHSLGRVPADLGL
ncbi:MAG: radical SAM protein [Elusimicrobiota bacterium]